MTHQPIPTIVTLRRLRSVARQRGLTLVELMVALVVGLMVILAAMSVFSSSSQSARTVDHAGQLRDDARFAADIIQRLAVQTGFEDIGFVTRTYQGTPQSYAAINGKVNPLTMKAPISGFSGKKVTDTDSIDIVAGANSPDSKSDVLVLRYQAVNKGDSDGDADGSMMVCSGHTLGAGDGHDSDHRDQRAVSVFYVDNDDDGEPTLYCRWTNKEGEALKGPTPLVKGVESFKVLYGVDNIEAETAADKNDATAHAKLIPNSYFNADQMVVDSDLAATETNWRRVRALRIGLVLRSARNAGPSDSDTVYPLGENFGAAYTPTGFDTTRLRQNYVFTVNVRNCLNQGYQAAGDPGKSASEDVPPCDVIVPRPPTAAASA